MTDDPRSTQPQRELSASDYYEEYDDYDDFNANGGGGGGGAKQKGKSSGGGTIYSSKHVRAKEALQKRPKQATDGKGK